MKVWWETDEVRLQASESAFLKGTKLTANPLREGATFDRVSVVLEESALDFVAYDITAVWNDAVVQPGNTVEAIFTIPEGWKHEALEVVYISEDFDIEKPLVTFARGQGDVNGKDEFVVRITSSNNEIFEVGEILVFHKVKTNL